MLTSLQVDRSKWNNKRQSNWAWQRDQQKQKRERVVDWGKESRPIGCTMAMLWAVFLSLSLTWS